MPHLKNNKSSGTRIQPPDSVTFLLCIILYCLLYHKQRGYYLYFLNQTDKSLP